MLTAAFLFVHRVEFAHARLALAAIVAFVPVRGVARWPELAASAAGLAVAAAIVLAWYGAGALLLAGHARSPRTPRSLAVATACTLGAGAWSLFWFFAGLGGAYRPAVAVVAALAGLLFAGVALARDKRARPPDSAADPDGPGDTPPASGRGAVAVPATFIGVAALIAAVAALAPPTAKDALQYHIALPKAFIEAGRLFTVGESIVSYSPLGVEMHGLWGMLLGGMVSARVGEAAFGATTFALFPLLLAAVHGWVREGVADAPGHGGRAWALTAAAIVATMPVVYDVASSGYVDLGLALTLVIAVRSAARWWATGAPRELAIVALAGGFALGVKLLAIFPAVVLGLAVLLGTRRARRGAGAALAAIAGMLAIAAPWYVRTWWLTGSPFFPYYLDLWPGTAPGWDVARSAMARAFNDAYGGDKSAPGFLLLPFRVSLFGQREVAAYYESALGVVLLVAVPALVWALWRRRVDGETVVAGAVTAAMFAWWAASAHVLRYALPALVLAAVVAARAVARATADPAERAVARRLRMALLLPACGSLVLTLAWFVTAAPMFVVTGAEPRVDYLSRRLDYYPYYRIIDTLPADARVWLVDVRRDTYHLTRAYRGDYLFEDYTLRDLLARGADVRQWAREAGITHVFIRHDLLFDPQRSALVDDRLPPEENVARLRRLRDFLLDGTRVVAGDRKFLLVALP